MSQEGEDIWKDQGHRAGDLKANSQDFHYTTEDE
jgi:hypothetical protein